MVRIYDKNFFNEIAKSHSQKPDNSKKSIPNEETFSQVLEKAKNGNEMAALHIYEWQELYKKNKVDNNEIGNMIDKAAKQLFK